jgi:SagB-type dehydrogenase family enzyme
MTERAGDDFQEKTKYYRDRMPTGGLDWASKPDQYKEYPGASRIDLGCRTRMETLSLDEALLRRKSIRHYAPTPMTTDQISYLLWAATGLQRTERGNEYRTAPSAGALYPVETYVVANRIEEVPAGVYHYSVRHHSLEIIKEGEFSSDIAIAALGQKMCLEAAAVFIWTAIFRRSKWKYGERAYRYIYLDAGHIGQNLALAATAIGLGSCQVGALFDEEVNSIIGVDGTEESVVYMSVAGKPHLG